MRPGTPRQYPDRATVTITAVTLQVLTQTQSSDITWFTTVAASFQVEVRGTGVPGSGTIVDSGNATAGTPIVTNIRGVDLLPGNNPVHVIVNSTPAGVAGTQLMRDDEAPRVAITGPQTSTQLGTTRQIQGTAIDNIGVASVEIATFDSASSTYWDDGAGAFTSPTPLFSAAPGAPNWTYALPAAMPLGAGATITFTARALDQAGRQTSANRSYTMLVAGISVQFVSPALVAPSGSSDITWESNASDSYRVEVGGTGTAGSGLLVESGNVIAGAPVVSTVLATELVADSANTVWVILGSSPNDQATVTHDGIPPQVAVTGPIDGVGLLATGAVSGVASDANGVARVDVAFETGGQYFDGNGFGAPAPVWFRAVGTTSWTWTVPKALGLRADTTYQVQARATDLAGLVSAPFLAPFITKDQVFIGSCGCLAGRPEDVPSMLFGLTAVFLPLFLGLVWLRRWRIPASA